ncbi:MAG: hypothetical protein ACPLKP_00975 [Microgenomates group bacterium]
MKIERKNFGPSGDIPLPLALRRVEEWRGEKIEDILKLSEWLIKNGIPQKLVFLAVPVISILAGLPLREVKGVKELVIGILESKNVPPPQRKEEKKQEFLKAARDYLANREKI